MRLRRVLYRMGLRPRLGSIWYSPSLSMIYAFKDAKFVETMMAELAKPPPIIYKEEA
jgi:hypothetical protein